MNYEYRITPPGDGSNCIGLWQSALAAVQAHGGGKIIFAPGTYDFFPEGCTRKYCFFSNNDEGVKTIAMHIAGVNGLTIAGEGALLLFHGRISPLAAFNCRDLTVSGIAVDFTDSFVSDADIVEVENDVTWFKIGGQHSFDCGKLVFTGDFYDNFSGKLNFYPLHPEKAELLQEQKNIAVDNAGLLEKNGLIGIRRNFAFPTTRYVIKHELRFCPGMVFDRCFQVCVDGVKLHHAAGMGILFQQSGDIEVCRTQIVPRGRRASVSDDALHLTECRGKIRVADSIFAGTLDDNINIHSVYRPLKERIPGTRFHYLDTGHYQQAGLPGAYPGDTLELVKNDTGKPYGRLKLTGTRVLTKTFTLVNFAPEELPAEFVPGDCARVVESAEAEVTVENCRFSTLNGRGVLAAGMKKAVIRNNYFHTSGAAVFVSGDTGFWYEAGPVGEMDIYGNTFDNCCFCRWGATREVVSVFPEISRSVPGFAYHGRISVYDNTFRSPFRTLVSMKNVACAEVTGNDFITENVYEYLPGNESGYFFSGITPSQCAFMDCLTVTENGNRQS